MAEQALLDLPAAAQPVAIRPTPTRAAKVAAKPGAMTYRQAEARLAKVGASHAQGDALRAMYAFLLAGRMRGADPARMYAYLKNNDNLLDRYKALCEDPWLYCDALLTSPG